MNEKSHIYGLGALYQQEQSTTDAQVTELQQKIEGLQKRKYDTQARFTKPKIQIMLGVPGWGEEITALPNLVSGRGWMKGM